MGCELIPVFIGLLQLATAVKNNSSWIYIVYNSLWHALTKSAQPAVFASPLITGSSGGCSPSSGFPNCPRASVTVIQNSLSIPLPSRLTLCTSLKKAVLSQSCAVKPPAYNFSAQIAQKTSFLIIASFGPHGINIFSVV
jgi:hypothetical protein